MRHDVMELNMKKQVSTLQDSNQEWLQWVVMGTTTFLFALVLCLAIICACCCRKCKRKGQNAVIVLHGTHKEANSTVFNGKKKSIRKQQKQDASDISQGYEEYEETYNRLPLKQTHIADEICIDMEEPRKVNFALPQQR